jgi:ATP-dependent Clp protease protease subunit
MKKISNKVERNAAGRIWVNEFSEEAAAKICVEIIKTAERDETEPIILYIDSFGGDVHALASIISVVDSVPNPLITIATGKAISCGAFLLSHGDIRCAGRHAVIMMHEISSRPGYSNVNDLRTDADETQRLNDHFVGLLAKNCGKSLAQVKKLFQEKRDQYMTPEQGKKFGIIDQIGIPLFERHIQYAMKFGEAPNEEEKPKNKKKR